MLITEEFLNSIFTIDPEVKATILEKQEKLKPAEAKALLEYLQKLKKVEGNLMKEAVKRNPELPHQIAEVNKKFNRKMMQKAEKKISVDADAELERLLNE